MLPASSLPTSSLPTSSLPASLLPTLCLPTLLMSSLPMSLPTLPVPTLPTLSVRTLSIPHAPHEPLLAGWQQVWLLHGNAAPASLCSQSSNGFCADVATATWHPTTKGGRQMAGTMNQDHHERQTNHDHDEWGMDGWRMGDGRWVGDRRRTTMNNCAREHWALGWLLRTGPPPPHPYFNLYVHS